MSISAIECPDGVCHSHHGGHAVPRTAMQKNLQGHGREWCERLAERIYEMSVDTYAQTVIDNAKALANALVKRGYRIVSGGTDNHMFVIDLRPQEITGKTANDRLEEANITVSKSMIPNDPEKPWVTSGIRIGTPAITTRGLTPSNMDTVAHLINKSLTTNEKESVRHEVIDLARKYPMP